MIHIPAAVAAVVSTLTQAGGKAMLVGGGVVDALLGREPKDWDIEVYGFDIFDIETALAAFKPRKVGLAFGILKLSASRVEGLDIDVSVPRRDNKIGVGHTGFEVTLDPRMSPQEAAMRRDFTINSLAYDLASGEVIDPFGGIADLENGILRATNPKTFVEDPLRALRAMQLLARKARIVDSATMDLIRGMHDEFQYLPKERVHEEWRKLLLKADRPSIGLEFLRESGWLSHFPELARLPGCAQNPDWHPEGDVWAHTCHVADSAAWARDKVDAEWREAFVFGALLHDVGKPDTTIFPEMVASGEAPANLLWTAYGHDHAGEAPAQAFMQRLTTDNDLIKRSSTIVREHMQPYSLTQGSAKMGAWRRLHGKIRLDVIGWMSRCDACGCPDHMKRIGDPDLDHEVSRTCWSHFDDVGGPKPVAALLQGRDLMAAGFKPGLAFGVALKAAYEAQLDDESLDIPALLEIARPLL